MTARFITWWVSCDFLLILCNWVEGLNPFGAIWKRVLGPDSIGTKVKTTTRVADFSSTKEEFVLQELMELVSRRGKVPFPSSGSKMWA